MIDIIFVNDMRGHLTLAKAAAMSKITLDVKVGA